jgi:ADP-ribose pyrophosphatase YjhB (NUDIX family)
MRFCPQCASRLEEREIEGRRRPACPTCGFVWYLDPKVAVAVVVLDEGRVLLCRRTADPGRGRWSFPAGFVDRGERVEAAAAREVREETGLEVALGRLVGVYSEEGNPVVLVVFVGRPVGGRLRPSHEVAELGFFSPDDLPPLAFRHDRAILRDALAAAEGQSERNDRPLGGCDRG